MTAQATGVAEEADAVLAGVRAEVRRRRPGGAGEGSARELLEPLGLPFVAAEVVDSAEEAVAAARRSGFPVVLKAVSDAVLHKSDAGLVELGLGSAEAVREAHHRLAGRIAAAGATDARVLVQPMVGAGTDLILGWVRDPAFGPVLVVGLGGVTVELFRDVARRIAPVTATEAHDLLRSLTCWPLLAGFRGAPPVDTAEFCELVARVGELASAVPELTELDLNPVRISAEGRCTVLDARAVIERTAEAPSRQSAFDLGALARPGCVAVVGASRDARRPGGRVLEALREHGFAGHVHPVNPAGGEIGGLPAVASLAELDHVPDLVCVALPAEPSVEVVGECARRGVPAVIVYASGFGETGAVGKELDTRLLAEVAGSGTIVCGPNTIGVVSSHHRMAATFSQAVRGLPLHASGTCLVAQSGAVAGSLVSRELADGYGIGDWVTVGNQSQVDVADYVEYYAGLETTRSVALFLEGVPDGGRFRRALAAARDRGVPVAVFKTGVTEAGSRAVSSHSGALAGSGEAYRAALAQEGAVQVAEMTNLLEIAWTLGHTPLPAGRRVAVVTTSGGAGSATVDLVDAAGLVPAVFDERTRSRLAEVLPGFANVDNPLDVTAEGAFGEGVVRRAVELVVADEGVDLVCLVLTSITGADAVRVARQIAEAAAGSGKPVLVSWLVARSLAKDGMSLLAERGLRVFTEPARMVAAAAALTSCLASTHPRSACV
ncbi:acetate--CoA ligase family protein [Amycolatopsis rhabdoformis]|uniref:Acetate--CoA ligase family protein n=1 Tax=Amycolatopsis rhabdoformis TaxID=1448059 RepID=A0ABZ1IF85_9PSEU|nr:acetate--CoA ligase family protein [Amycolatopsis rhabdoformis]WSE32209.1 acetate--CoA ligase family protein [Amycolatopsis rhabdoformis]